MVRRNSSTRDRGSRAPSQGSPSRGNGSSQRTSQSGSCSSVDGFLESPLLNILFYPNFRSLPYSNDAADNDVLMHVFLQSIFGPAGVLDLHLRSTKDIISYLYEFYQQQAALEVGQARRNSERQNAERRRSSSNHSESVSDTSADTSELDDVFEDDHDVSQKAPVSPVQQQPRNGSNSFNPLPQQPLPSVAALRTPRTPRTSGRIVSAFEVYQDSDEVLNAPVNPIQQQPPRLPIDVVDENQDGAQQRQDAKQIRKKVGEYRLPGYAQSPARNVPRGTLTLDQNAGNIAANVQAPRGLLSSGIGNAQNPARNVFGRLLSIDRNAANVPAPSGILSPRIGNAQRQPTNAPSAYDDENQYHAQRRNTSAANAQAPRGSRYSHLQPQNNAGGHSFSGANNRRY